MPNIVDIILRTQDESTSTINSLSGRMDAFGSNLQSVGQRLGVAIAPLALGLGLAVNSATSFDASMTNVGAVLGRTREEMTEVREEILAMGADSIAGPQAVADAFYNVVGGVADSTTHMDILSAAIATSEAGAADLGVTTTALISTMNSYAFAADDAAYVSDVLTQTVGKGVGTMDEFAGALPQVTGLASSLSISFGDVGSMMAYLTTQGSSASSSATQLTAIMTAMLNPNAQMKAALEELGFASGQAAVEQLGLVGAITAIQGTDTAANSSMATLLGSVDALRGSVALGTDAFETFNTTYTEGITGATTAAQAIQLDGASAQFSQLQSTVSALGIELGSVLVPILVDLAAQVKPVVESIIGWIKENPQLTQTVLAIVAGLAVLAPIVMVVGGAISLASTIVAGITAAFGLLTAGAGLTTAALGTMVAPILALIAPVAAVTAAVLAAVAAFQQLQTFKDQLSTSSTMANSVIAPMVQNGTVSREEVFDRTFQATAAEFGGGFGGDLAARLFAPLLYNAATNPSERDFGGQGTGGRPVLIGTGAQPELFIPDSSGIFIPNGNMGGIQIGTIQINANGYEQGRGAMNGALDAIRERQLARGTT
jgi:TP901 family phage tail tape measure protein